MLARLARFYDTGIFYLPGWALEALYKCIDPLRAEEATWQTNATRTGTRFRNREYEQQIRRWTEAARPIRQVDTAVTIDPRFEEWFKANKINYRLADGEPPPQN
jgi:hypothetical protein